MTARWYKRCGADFIHGTMMLTLEEKGAYSLCLDLIYDRGGPIPDDARWLSGVCGVSIRKWNAIRQRLIDLGKLSAGHSMLSNARADLELVSAALSSRERAESGAKGGRKRAENAGHSRENNDLGEAELKREEKRREEESSVANATVGEADDPLKVLFDTGVQILTAAGQTEKQARSLIGKWRKGRSDGDVLTALIDCRARAISEPVEWLQKRFGGVKHVSASGYEYRGTDREIMREAERRGDMATYWAMKAEPSSTGPPKPKADRAADPNVRRLIGQATQSLKVGARA
jgi:uncharacterized protein YdaU (DUF1376 family)